MRSTRELTRGAFRSPSDDQFCFGVWERDNARQVWEFSVVLPCDDTAYEAVDGTHLRSQLRSLDIWVRPRLGEDASCFSMCLQNNKYTI